MVEKMKLLHITGPRDDIDRVMRVHLNQYEIHFENAMTSLSSLRSIRPFVETNIYKEVLQKGKEIKKYLGENRKPADREYTPQQAKEIIEHAYEKLEAYFVGQKRLEQEIQDIREWMQQIAPFNGLDFEFEKLKDFHFIDYRFGRISLENYHKIQHYIYHNQYTLFYECNSDSEYVWGVYFVPHIHEIELEALYASFHFEEVLLPDDFRGTPKDALEEAARAIAEKETQWKQMESEMESCLKEEGQEIQGAWNTLESYCDNFEIRKFAACTKSEDSGEEFYILYGWMSEKEAGRLEEELEKDDMVYWVEETADGHLSTSPPTRLKNPKILKPFEMFVEMYGLPAYNEMDPTFFVALTYTLMFGIMFGDVGQGLVLAAGGFILYRIKGIRLAGIISLAGIWSVFFGIMYGSVFGFEELLPAVWMKPMDNIMNVLMLAIGFGALLIVIAMILNIVNAVRAKEYGRLLFNQSGLAGLVCYGFAALCAILIITGNGLPATVIIALAVGVPLVAILLKEPLTHLVEKKPNIFPKGSKIMFFVEALVEGFDVVLSYATNTISFVRVGAFALSHAGMMGVVMTLAGLEKGNPNWLVIILGNILVAGLEGLVVGIQVLRLEYYEMFSRFYKGNGKPFISFNKRKQQ